jgi:hypothetical protein
VKRLLVGGAILALGLSGMATGFADPTPGQGAQKSPLSAVDTTNACDSSSDAGAGDTTGFAILNGAGKVGAIKKIVGEVSLKAGQPNSEYAVFVAEEGGDCMPTGTLSTNEVGHGNSHIDSSHVDGFPAAAGTYYVVLQDADGSEVFASAPVPIS